MRNLCYRFGTPLSFMLLLAPVARPQQQQQQQQDQQQQQQQGQTQQQQQSTEQPSQPIPAYHSPLASLAPGNEQDENTSPSELTPDTRPLAGAQELGLGMPRGEHSFWQPSFSVNSTFDSNAQNSTGSSSWGVYTTLLGSLDLHRASENSDLSLTYAGGGTISGQSSVGNSVVQEFELGDRISLRRAAISFFDQMSYIPEAGFGYGGLGGLSLPGFGSLGLQTGLLPNESILTARDQRISNSSIVQVDAYLTPRSSLTFMGGYSLLHFFGSDYLDSGDVLFQAGYNYQINREDTIAVQYNFSGYRYGGLNESLDDHKVSLSYGRRVTGRLAFQVAGGPDFLVIQAPPSGTGGSGGTGSGGLSSGTKFYWSLHTGLNYQLRRTEVGLSYDHGVNGGSGVLVGAVGDIVTGVVNRSLSRELSADARFGYSRNEALIDGSQNYSYWFGGMDLSRPWGRSLSLALSYQFQYQNSNESFCIATTCGESLVRHIISIGLRWHEHPLGF